MSCVFVHILVCGFHFLTLVVDVICVAVLFLFFVTITSGHDQVTRPSYISFLCKQEVTINCSTADVMHLPQGWNRKSRSASQLNCLRRCVPVRGVVVMSTAPRSFLRRSSCCCCFLFWASTCGTSRESESGNTHMHTHSHTHQLFAESFIFRSIVPVEEGDISVFKDFKAESGHRKGQSHIYLTPPIMVWFDVNNVTMLEF